MVSTDDSEQTGRLHSNDCHDANFMNENLCFNINTSYLVVSVDHTSFAEKAIAISRSAALFE